MNAECADVFYFRHQHGTKNTVIVDIIVGCFRNHSIIFIHILYSSSCRLWEGSDCTCWSDSGVMHVPLNILTQVRGPGIQPPLKNRNDSNFLRAMASKFERKALKRPPLASRAKVSSPGVDARLMGGISFSSETACGTTLWKRFPIKRKPLLRPCLQKFTVARPRIGCDEGRTGTHASSCAVASAAGGLLHASVKLRRPVSQRTVVLRFADVRDKGVAEAWVVWSRLLAMFGGRTARVAARLGIERGRLHIQTLLKRWVHRTLHLHAAGVLKFVEWHSGLRSGQALQPPSAENAVQEKFVAMLVYYIHDLREAGARPTVPASRIASLAFLNKIAALDNPLPLPDVSVTAAVQSHRRNAKGKRRKTTIYTRDEVHLLERSARALPSALSRTTLQTELRKVYAALRNDDSIWD